MTRVMKKKAVDSLPYTHERRSANKDQAHIEKREKSEGRVQGGGGGERILSGKRITLKLVARNHVNHYLNILIQKELREFLRERNGSGSLRTTASISWLASLIRSSFDIVPYNWLCRDLL